MKPSHRETYDNIGQLKTAQAYEADGVTKRQHEQFGYAYDAAWNLSQRTNNALIQSFGVNNLNELTNATRSGTFTVAGTTTEPGGNVTSVTVSGTGLTSGNAAIYMDGMWARTNATLANGANSYTAVALDSSGRSDTATVSVNLPATSTFTYDLNGNLLSDGTRFFIYDDENQLLSVTVSNSWQSQYVYDGLNRRRIAKDLSWNGSSFVETNEVRYVYDGNLVLQERDTNNLPLVSYTRGSDFSASFQDAGGIGGLLARTDNRRLLTGDINASAYYQSDDNGNVMAMFDLYGQLVAQYAYDPYGNILSMSGPMASANKYRFSSKEWDENAGIYYYGFRFYEPSLQRWPNRDPIEEKGGIHLYRFSSNNSINYVDKLGLYNPITGPNGPVSPGSGLPDPIIFFPPPPPPPQPPNFPLSFGPSSPSSCSNNPFSPITGNGFGWYVNGSANVPGSFIGTNGLMYGNGKLGTSNLNYTPFQ